ncbi:hypothetical protein, partial [Secundilactobacillus similis]|uniref:hypothetical protein n=1 Tax=Secundilactobacillus similis TaxID=414682 RepID=UPI000AE3F889
THRSQPVSLRTLTLDTNDSAIAKNLCKQKLKRNEKMIKEMRDIGRKIPYNNGMHLNIRV